MKDGIKFNLIYQILLEEHMVQIILKHCGKLFFIMNFILVFKFMLIVELEEFTLAIVFIVKKNYHLNSSYSYPFKNKDEHYYIYSLIKQINSF